MEFSERVCHRLIPNKMENFFFSVFALNLELRSIEDHNGSWKHCSHKTLLMGGRGQNKPIYLRRDKTGSL